MSRHQGSSNPDLVGKWTASKTEATSWGMPPDKDFWAGLSICAAPVRLTYRGSHEIMIPVLKWSNGTAAPRRNKSCGRTS
jgi:hypothetical protein